MHIDEVDDSSFINECIPLNDFSAVAALHEDRDGRRGVAVRRDHAWGFELVYQS